MLPLCSEGTNPQLPRREPAKIKPHRTPCSCSAQLSQPHRADGETSPGHANPNKALYCLTLWLISIYSLVEPKKTFHLVPKPGGSRCPLKTASPPTPRGSLAATPPVRAPNQGRCCRPSPSWSLDSESGSLSAREAALLPKVIVLRRGQPFREKLFPLRDSRTGGDVLRP